MDKSTGEGIMSVIYKVIMGLSMIQNWVYVIVVMKPQIKL